MGEMFQNNSRALAKAEAERDEARRIGAETVMRESATLKKYAELEAKHTELVRDHDRLHRAFRSATATERPTGWVEKYEQDYLLYAKRMVEDHGAEIMSRELWLREQMRDVY